jgi:dGTPase
VPELEEYRRAGQPLLEARVADAADSLAYDAHDVDDALSAGLIGFADLRDVRLWRRALDGVRQRYGELPPEQFQPTVVRALIDWQADDLLAHTRAQLRRERITSVADVRACRDSLVGPGPEMSALKAELEAFLRQRVYQHTRVQRMALKGGRVVQALFDEFCAAPQLLPERYRLRIGAASPQRVVCDYVAGMTDRYAQDEYLRLFHPYTPV